MQIINFWNKLYLHCSKVILLLFFFGFSLTTFSQKKFTEKVINLPHYDERFFHYGFTVALNEGAYNIDHSDYFFNNTDSIIKINPDRTLGFTIGFIINLHINDNLDFRVLPNVGFYERNISYQYTSSLGEVKQKIGSNMLELAMLLKFKSRREGNFRAYVIGGLKPSMEVSSQRAQSTGEKNLRVTDNDLVVEYGFGVDVYNPMFKFSPEIRFAHGLNNMLVKDPNVYAQTLDRVSTHTITLYFHFE